MRAATLSVLAFAAIAIARVPACANLCKSQITAAGCISLYAFSLVSITTPVDKYFFLQQ